MVRGVLMILIFLVFKFSIAQDYKRAPNSYIYDINYAEVYRYGGLQIPVIKAYHAWNDVNGFLNQPIPNGVQTAYVYWEDVPGLIRQVEISGTNESANINVAIDSGKGKGNALISFHVGPNGDASDPIYWTWHVWVTDDPTNGIEYSKGFETDLDEIRFDPLHMDRNLGAVSDEFLGNDWNKSSGLFYQWGRKDPFPPLLHKDRSYYELTGLIGNIVDEDVNSVQGSHYNMVIRPYDNESDNIKYSIKNPSDFIIGKTSQTWFSSSFKQSDQPEHAWDLWADNFKGGKSNANSSNPDISSDSKSYELKSVYDPCPGGWRVISNYGREAVNNNLSPYGRGGGGNDDNYNAWSSQNGFYLDPNINNGKPLSNIYSFVENPSFENLKIYPKLGFDFSKVNGRNLGLIPVSGRFVLYPLYSDYTHAIYQDEGADGGLWSATFGSSNPRFVYFIADADQEDDGIGRYRFRINEVENSSAGLNVRCIKDPNEDHIGVFRTQYISTPEYVIYKNGLNNPNSYLIKDLSQALEIPVNKAFSVYNQILSENGDMLPESDLKANVMWTTNQELIDKIKIIPSADPKDSKIRVEFNEGQTGNAVVSLHNGSLQNPAYWSWHIWVPNSEIQTITYTTEDIINAEFHIINATKSKYPPLTTEFMDRNLGAIESFPNVSNLNSPNATEKELIKKSGGFHYQWGRKDPIPNFSFVGTDESYEIYKGIEVDANGKVFYQTITSNDYDSFYTEEYSTYSNAAGVNGSDDKFSKATKVLKYAVENPLNFLYHSGTGESYSAPNEIVYEEIRDWISNSVGSNGDRHLLANRWGHATEKSPFDPCPEGWRVPDVSWVLLRTSGKGTSPWYFGNNGADGVDQRDYYNISTSYGGEVVKVNSKNAGWIFNSNQYAIGNFPKTGIRGELGGMEISETTGVWTAAMSDYMTGYALGMQFNKENYMRTATGVYPQAAMNVRCSKDVPRYVADRSDLLNTEEFVIEEGESILVYPNPVHDFLNIHSQKDLEYSLFDINGKLIRSEKTKNNRIEFSQLPKGVYILILDNQFSKKIIKK